MYDACVSNGVCVCVCVRVCACVLSLPRIKFFNTISSLVYRPPGEPTVVVMASEDIAKLAETLAKTQVAGGQLSFKGKGLKLNTAEDGKCLGWVGDAAHAC